MSIKYSASMIIIIFSTVLCCAGFLIPRKEVKPKISTEYLMRVTARLMRTWSSLLYQFSIIQTCSIDTIEAVIKNNKAYPLMTNQENRSLFVRHINQLQQACIKMDEALADMVSFLQKNKFCKEKTTI